GVRDRDRVKADRERGLLVELGLPAHAALGLLALELFEPQVAEGVAHLLERDRLAALEPQAVVDGEHVVDARAEEHRPAGGGALAEQVVAAPVLRAQQEAAVGGGGEVAQRLAVQAYRQMAR